MCCIPIICFIFMLQGEEKGGECCNILQNATK
jgi:hypothetical protein